MTDRTLSDDLAQFIRTIDGNNSMGAGELAEEICERFGCALLAQVPIEPVAHVNLRTRPGCGDGVTWTNGALPHGTPLYAAPIAQAPQPSGLQSISKSEEK